MPMPDAADRRTFRRSTSSRLIGSACALLFGGGAIAAAAAPGATTAFYVLLGLSALSLFNLVGVWADRYTLDETGIEQRNILLCRFGVRARRIGWEEIVGVREVFPLRRDRGGGAPTAVFLTLRGGRRLVLDSLHRFDDLLATLRRRSEASGSPPVPGDGP
jgi:hypothetical protein